MLISRCYLDLSVPPKTGEAPAKGGQGPAVGTVRLREGAGRGLGVLEQLVLGTRLS